MTLLEKLEEKGIVSKEVISTALSKGGSTADALAFLLQQKLLTHQDLAKTRAELYNLELNELPKNFKIPHEFLQVFSQRLISQLKIIPISQSGNEMTVGVVEPENLAVDSALNFIAVSHKVSIKRVVISALQFDSAMRASEKLETEVKEVLEKIGVEKEIKEGLKEKISTEAQLQRFTEAAPVTRMVDVILRYGVDANASDIHIEPTEYELRVRFRIDGKLKASLFLPKDLLPAIISRVKILSKLRVDETRIPQDGRIHIQFETRSIDFRVATFPTIHGEKVVLRILDPKKGITTLENLGLMGRNLEKVRSFMQRPFGAMLISGPTGSGKSTTLYTVLNDLNSENSNIVTLEDPVEYYISGINQSQIRPEIDYDFGRGLRQIVRQDPNIIMVGEVRDKETASLLIHAALTGHLVFSTIHTNNAIGIIPRLLDMNVDSFLIPSALGLAVAQRLIPKLCDDCKQEYDPLPAVKDVVKRGLSSIPKDVLEEHGVVQKAEHIKLFKSGTCDACGMIGFRGRIGVFETLTVGEEMEEVIIESPKESDLEKEAKRQNMTTMRQDAIMKALKGVIDIESVLANTLES